MIERPSSKSDCIMKDPLTDRIIGCAIEVHKNMGPGLWESVYEACLCEEFKDNGLDFEKQKEIEIVYKGTPLEKKFRADLVVEKQVLVELKAVDELKPIHEAQLLTYMRLTETRVGLLLNFNTTLLKNGIQRMVL